MAANITNKRIVALINALTATGGSSGNSSLRQILLCRVIGRSTAFEIA